MRELYGAEYLPDAPRTYASKVKNAQEAHEAIRPAGESFRTPAQTGLTGDQFRLYELIWMRTVASQMKDAVGQSVSIRIGGRVATDRRGRRLLRLRPGDHLPRLPQGLRRGHRRRCREGRPGDPAAGPAEGDPVSAASLSANGHETKPPARYTEATLIKELEDREIGRPSTYASIIGTILNRGYVYKKGTALVPAWIAFSVVRLLEEHFTRLIDYEFTAQMETVLDEIARGEKDRITELHEFYYGSDRLAGSSRWSTGSATSTPRSSRPSRSVTPRKASTCGSASTGPTSRVPTTTARRPPSGPTCPTTCRPTS